MLQMDAWGIYDYAEISSTNDKAKELTIAPPQEFFVVTAQRQTAGRGRRGRTWQSLEGNLFMSQAFPLETRFLTDAAFIVSLSLFDAVAVQKPQGRLRLKWPNDILLENRKISGILLEKGENEYIIAGIGVNLKTAPAAESGLLYPAAALTDFGIRCSKEQLLRAYLQAFDENYALWRRSGFMPIRERWLTHVVGLRQEIVVNFEHGRETGIFEDIAPNGALLLRKGDGIIPVLAADIFYKEENKD